MFSPSRRLLTAPNHAGPAKVCLAQTEARERRMLPGHTQRSGLNERLLTPCWCSPSACAVHRAYFSLFRAKVVTFKGACLSHTALSDCSGWSSSLSDPFSLHHNTTELFHVKSTRCSAEKGKYFLLLICRSTNPHRACKHLSWDIQEVKGRARRAIIPTAPCPERWERDQAAPGSKAPTCP